MLRPFGARPLMLALLGFVGAAMAFVGNHAVSAGMLSIKRLTVR